VIHLEAPTHRIPAGKTDRDDEAGPLLTASDATYEEARDALYEGLSEGYRLTWIRRVDATEARS
jgi:hypothetical protein